MSWERIPLAVVFPVQRWSLMQVIQTLAVLHESAQVGSILQDILKVGSVMGAGLWSASPLSKPSTQTSMVSLFGMVPAGPEPSTRLLGLIRYLGVVSWSMG